jgi:hypothetical protein
MEVKLRDIWRQEVEMVAMEKKRRVDARGWRTLHESTRQQGEGSPEDGGKDKGGEAAAFGKKERPERRKGAGSRGREAENRTTGKGAEEGGVEVRRPEARGQPGECRRRQLEARGWSTWKRRAARSLLGRF